MNCSSGNCYNWATFSQLFSYRNQIKLPYHELKIYQSHCEFPTAKIQRGESSMHPLIIALIGLIGERSQLVFQPRISVILFFFGINEYIHIPCWEESLFRRSLIHHKSFFNLTNYTVLNYICLSPKSCSVAGFITLQLWYVTVTISNR